MGSDLTMKLFPNHIMKDTYSTTKRITLVSGMKICFNVKIVPLPSNSGNSQFSHTIFVPFPKLQKVFHLPVVGTILPRNCLNLTPVFYPNLEVGEQINHSLIVDLSE
jgi:hypothetical protein